MSAVSKKVPVKEKPSTENLVNQYHQAVASGNTDLAKKLKLILIRLGYTKFK